MRAVGGTWPAGHLYVGSGNRTEVLSLRAKRCSSGVLSSPRCCRAVWWWMGPSEYTLQGQRVGFESGCQLHEL